MKTPRTRKIKIEEDTGGNGCKSDCGHTIKEHAAFDKGLRDGGEGQTDSANPYRAHDLREAWATGHSVGVLNRRTADLEDHRIRLLATGLAQRIKTVTAHSRLPGMKTHTKIPKSHPVQPLKAGQTAKDKATCGTCGLSWDDGKITSLTPAPSARCPFEYFHIYPK